ncbi:MAG: hypothetical protein ABL901_16355 [Hyphomicrobiaceae bacterium]
MVPCSISQFKPVFSMLVFAGTVVCATGAEAVTTFQKSLFTSIDRKACTTLRSHPDGNAYRCPGLDGFPIYLAEGDHRTFVAGSIEPEKTRAAQQTLGAFNTPFLHSSHRAIIEWRFTIKEKRKVPFAMIVRYFTEMNGRKGEVLVVTRIAGKEACHVGYVDALANANAIVLARRIADERARTFDCRTDPSIEGERGRSPL